MAQGVNKVIIVGNLGRDPELRYTQSGTAVANFSVATTERWTDRDGQKQEHTEWHRVVAWARLAEIVGEYLSKGRQVYVEGSIRTRQWEDRDGNTRYTTEIRCDNMIMLGSRGDDFGGAPGGPPDLGGPPSGGGGQGGGGGGQGGGDQGGDADGGITDDDIPF